MKFDNVKHAARGLLDRRVSFPGPETDDSSEVPSEVEGRLGARVPEFIFDLLGEDPETLAEILGPAWERSVVDFDAACSALKRLATTGQVDEPALRSGEGAIDALLNCVAADAAKARSMLDPDAPATLEHHERMRLSSEQISRDMRLTYAAYLGFRCGQEALEILRDGLAEINRAIAQVPPPRRGR